jgi:hypothetical protein
MESKEQKELNRLRKLEKAIIKFRKEFDKDSIPELKDFAFFQNTLGEDVSEYWQKVLKYLSNDTAKNN